MIAGIQNQELLLENIQALNSRAAHHNAVEGLAVT